MPNNFLHFFYNEAVISNVFLVGYSSSLLRISVKFIKSNLAFKGMQFSQRFNVLNWELYT